MKHQIQYFVLRECLRSIRFSNIIGIVIDINEKVLNTMIISIYPKISYVNNELRKLKLKNKEKWVRSRQITEKDITELNADEVDHDKYDELIESNEYYQWMMNPQKWINYILKQ